MGFTNGYKMISALLVSAKASFNVSTYQNRHYITKFKDGNGYYADLSGAQAAYLTYLNSDFASNYTINSNSRSYILIGDSDTPFDSSDYCLGHEIASGYITYSNNSIIGNTLCNGYPSFCSTDPNNVYVELTAVGKNTTENDLIIKEVGVSKPISCRDNPDSSSTTIRQLMIFREVLDTPIEVPVGSTYMFKIRITFP